MRSLNPEIRDPRSRSHERMLAREDVFHSRHTVETVNMLGNGVLHHQRVFTPCKTSMRSTRYSRTRHDCRHHCPLQAPRVSRLSRRNAPIVANLLVNSREIHHHLRAGRIAAYQPRPCSAGKPLFTTPRIRQPDAMLGTGARDNEFRFLRLLTGQGGREREEPEGSGEGGGVQSPAGGPCQAEKRQLAAGGPQSTAVDLFSAGVWSPELLLTSLVLADCEGQAGGGTEVHF